MSWLNVVKFLCWVGWHMWEYVYSSTGEEQHRSCKRCGIEQAKFGDQWK